MKTTTLVRSRSIFRSLARCAVRVFGIFAMGFCLILGLSLFPAFEGQFLYLVEQQLPTLNPHNESDSFSPCLRAKMRYTAFICIPKIRATAPLIPGSALQTKDTAGALAKGVILANEGARPGEKDTVLLFGHSSDAPWHKGNYKTAFLLINALVPKDEIFLITPDATYTYHVITSEEVSPRALQFSENKNESLLTLITCWPPGTTLRRLLVHARLVATNPTQRAPMTP